MLWLLKLALTPLLVALVTVVARRWGPRIGGILIGFPLMTGPLSLFLAIEQGLDFARSATVGILVGLVGLAAFALAYGVASRRLRWPGAQLAAAAAFVAASLAASAFDLGVVGSAVAAYAALAFAVVAIGRPRDVIALAPAPSWDLPLRMAVAGGLVAGVTVGADWLGPILSGVLGTYPAISSVVAGFTHHRSGREAAVALLRGSLLSWIAFVSCFLVIGLLLDSGSLAICYTLGTVAAVLTSFIVLRIDRRFARLGLGL